MSEHSDSLNLIDIQERWNKAWDESKIYESKPDNRPSYTVVIPPPNVTGVLHMGHSLNNTIQDILIRTARMTGYNACWVPGTDHASIATEAKVVAMLKEQGIDKKSLSREEFLKHAWEWKEKYGGIILTQLKELGCSIDWSRVNFTMDEHYYQSVIKVFVDLHNKGLIYRGFRMINWDCVAKTALSDEEVIFKEARSKLYYINYHIKDSADVITIATTRPETILADTAICVNPNDDRFKHLVGQKAIVPICHREIPIIADEYVDIEFGTGALKVTPAHDKNDFMLGEKHNLEMIDMLNEDGTLNEKAGIFIGEDRMKARKLIAKKLEEDGYLAKVEELNNKVGHSERTDAVVEPRISRQWFCNMKSLAKPALEAVVNKEINIIPENQINTYKYWMENIHEWCISRQLWWGQRIPAYYAPDGTVAVAENKEKALEILKEQTQNLSLKIEEITQDEDVLDTWFSSWLWPIAVFDGIRNPNNPDINYYYPTKTLVTGHEIIFFWVARMIMAGYEYLGEKPFDTVYFNGIVRDKQGRKMSKSLGNSPDLLELIKKFGADGVRFGVLISSPAGNDLLFDEKQCEQGRNFSNKLWNANKLIQLWKENHNESLTEVDYEDIHLWFEGKLNNACLEVEKSIKEFRLSDALREVYLLAWDGFCSWYLELLKPAEGQKLSKQGIIRVQQNLSKVLQLLHPFMPYITEELWNRNGNLGFIATSNMPKYQADFQAQPYGNIITDVISKVRNLRAELGGGSVEFNVIINSANADEFLKWESQLKKLAKINEVKFYDKLVTYQNPRTLTYQNHTFIIEVLGGVDIDEQIKVIQKEIDYLDGFMASVEKKLNNQKFVENAKPDIIEKERKKLADALAKKEALIQNLVSLKL